MELEQAPAEPGSEQGEEGRGAEPRQGRQGNGAAAPRTGDSQPKACMRVRGATAWTVVADHMEKRRCAEP